MTPTQFYREPNGDYLCIEPTTRRYYSDERYEGRAAAIAGQPTSVCTTDISAEYLRQCRRVRHSAVPAEWREWF